MISYIFEYGKSFYNSDLCAGKVLISLPVYISLSHNNGRKIKNMTDVDALHRDNNYNNLDVNFVINLDRIMVLETL